MISSSKNIINENGCIGDVYEQLEIVFLFVCLKLLDKIQI